MKTLTYAFAVTFALAIVIGASNYAISKQNTPNAPVLLQSTTPGTQQTGSFNVSGVAKAGNFSGNGSLINNIGAPNITTGLLGDARLGPNIPRINGLNTFSGVNRFASNVIMTSQNTTILFPAVGAGAQKPMMTMFASGTVNMNRMVIAHSLGFPDYGLGYNDSSDAFVFKNNSNNVFTVSLSSGQASLNSSTPLGALTVVPINSEPGLVVTNPGGTNHAIVGRTGLPGTLWPYSDFAGVMGEAGTASERIGVIGTSSSFIGTYSYLPAAAGANGWASFSRHDGTGYAGYFDGKVQVAGNLDCSGTLSKGGGSFKIDHPLDPANKFLYHSFVESPDMMNIYNGLVRTDNQGYATVTMPDWFEALNQDFRYQLTVIDDGQDSSEWALVRVTHEMQDGRFRIRTNVPKVKVSWQVTGIRHDNFANAHRIPVEEMKPQEDRGYYLHPVENGADKSLSLGEKHGPQMTLKK